MSFWLNKTVLALTAFLGLGVALWVQTARLDSLHAKHAAQAQTLVQLNHQLNAERQAVISQQQIANQLKAQSEQAREKVRIIFKDSPCANTALPAGVAHQLHAQGAN